MVMTTSAVVSPWNCHITPNATEAPNRAVATTVCAALIPLARLATGTSWLARAASTPSVAA